MTGVEEAAGWYGEDADVARIRAVRAGCLGSATQGDRHAPSKEGCSRSQEDRRFGEGSARKGCGPGHSHAQASRRCTGGQPRHREEQTEAVLGDLVTLATRHLKKGDKIRLTGLGILQVRKRAARMGRNPATGEAIKIKASKKVAFRPAKELKEAV